MNLTQLRQFARAYGVTINTNAPGDGVRRYEFASEKYGILGRVAGASNAEAWFDGFTACYNKVMRGEHHHENPRRRSSSDTDPREVRRVYAGSTYWIRSAGRDRYMVTADGQPIINPTSYGRAARALLEVTGVDGAQPWVETWEERDNLVVRLYIGERGNANRSVEIASWHDDDARQMVEDGFFKPGRLFETSVIEYAADMKMIG